MEGGKFGAFLLTPDENETSVAGKGCPVALIKGLADVGWFHWWYQRGMIAHWELVIQLSELDFPLSLASPQF